MPENGHITARKQHHKQPITRARSRRNNSQIAIKIPSGKPAGALSVPNLHCDFHIRALAGNVVGIQRLFAAPLECAAFATQFAVVKAFPLVSHECEPFFDCRGIYAWGCHH